METPNVHEKGLLLREISNYLLFQLRVQGIDKVLDYNTVNDYRNGFERINVRQELLKKWSDNTLLDVKNMSVEIITVSGDMLHEIHFHEDAYAILTFLGEAEGVAEPTGSFYFYKSATDPLPVISGVTLDVSPYIVHGFTCPEGAVPIRFLSVQSKRIEHDFVVIS